MENNKRGIKEIIKRNKILYRMLFPIVKIFRVIYGVYIRTVCFYIGYYLRKVHLLKKDKIIDKLKGIYKGQRIFIVATGPSLKLSDLEWLHNNKEITISCNGIFKIFDNTDWRPDYYVMDDYFLYDSYKTKGICIPFENIAKKKILLSKPIKKRINYNYDNNKIGFFPICYFDHWFTHNSRCFKYNQDIVYGHFDLYTVTNTAINIAHYMGAKEIILLGVDCDYLQKKAHIGEKDSQENKINKKITIEMEKAQKRGYQFIANIFENQDTKIINATRGGSLEMFHRESIDNYIWKKSGGYNNDTKRSD